MTSDSITLNGSAHPLEKAVTVSELLAVLGLASKPVVVELNGSPVVPADHPTARVHPGDKVELITLAAGG